MSFGNTTIDEIEAFYDVSINVQNAFEKSKMRYKDSRTCPSIAYHLTILFLEKYKDADWGEIDYLETVDDFCEAELKKHFED